MTLRIGWYTTRGRSSRAMFEAVLDAIRAGTLDAEIAYVFSNRDPGDDPVTDAFFDLVRAEGIPLLALGSVAYRKTHGGERSKPGEPLPPWREAYDREVARLKLDAMDIRIDTLSAEQRHYLTSWQEGTG